MHMLRVITVTEYIYIFLVRLFVSNFNYIFVDFLFFFRFCHVRISSNYRK